MPRRNTARESSLAENRNQDEEDEEIDGQEGNVGSVAVGTNNGADRDEDEDDDGGDYGHAERAFLQAFLARSVMTREEVGSVLRRIWRVKAGKNNDDNDDDNNDGSVDDVREPTQSDISAAIAKANKALSPLDLAIRSARSQRDSALTTYALVMLGTVDPLGQSQSTQPLPQINSQHASFGGGSGGSGGGGGGSSQAWPSPTTYTADEQAYIRRVLDAIFETNNTPRAEVMAVKGMQAVRLHRAPQQQQQQQQQDQGSTHDANAGEWQNRQAQTIPMAQAEKLLARLVEEGWLERSEKGWYSLGMRGLIELREWLVETYNNADEEEYEDEEGEEGGISRRRSRGQLGQKWERIKFCDACKDIITIGQRCPTRTCLTRLHDACTDPFFRAVQARKCTRCGAEWTGNALVGERAAVTAGAGRSSTSIGTGERTSL